MNKPEYVYEVRTTSDEQIWIPYYYDFDNAVNKAIELIREMGYPEENIYSDNDSVIEHFFVEGVEDLEDPEKGDIEVAYIMPWLVEDYME